MRGRTQRLDVVRVIVGHGAPLGGIGAAIGLVGALAVTRFSRALSFGVSTFDAVRFVGVVAGLRAIARLASYIPARSARNVDPAEALRYE